MARYLPRRKCSLLGHQWSLNPGPWNAKEHALVVVAYWGSCHTAYGLGPLSALELYYGKRIGTGWSILFLVTTQLLGYGFAGVFRDILVRPPKLFYPGVLPNVALFNAMHRNPAVTRKSLTFFACCAIVAFCWQWLPQLFFPLLASLPIICWLGHGNPVAYVLGSGNRGFGILDFTFDWNYINGTMESMYTPLWASMNQFAGIFLAVWVLYPVLYYANVLDAQKYGAMSALTFDRNGNEYNVSRILTPDHKLNRTALGHYSEPYWSVPYVFSFYWGFAASTGACLYVLLWYGRDSWEVMRNAFGKRDNLLHGDDPYIRLMAGSRRVPHWWYLVLLAICFGLSLATIDGGNLDLPWWGFVIMSLIAWAFTLPSGILFAISDQMIGMNFLSEVIAGTLFEGKPIAVLTSLTYGRQILQQNLNLLIDYKFGFYMKIPETEMFIAQLWGTLLGPFINYAVMRVVIDCVGAPTLTGVIPSVSWNAAQTRNFFSISILWGISGPAKILAKGSTYSWVRWGFLAGPIAVLLVYIVQRWRPHWDMERICNPVMIFYGISLFPVFPTTNILTSFLASIFL